MTKDGPSLERVELASGSEEEDPDAMRRDTAEGQDTMCGAPTNTGRRRGGAKHTKRSNDPTRAKGQCEQQISSWPIGHAVGLTVLLTEVIKSYTFREQIPRIYRSA